MVDTPPTYPTPFGNGWNEYRKLILMYIEESKAWQDEADKRMAAIERHIAVICSQKHGEKLADIEKLLREFIDVAKHNREKIAEIREAQKLSRANTVKIWIAFITGILGLLSAVLPRLLGG